MKRLFFAFLSTAAVCAFVSATPVAAQETAPGAPRGEAPITAEPPYTPGYGYDYGPAGAAGAIAAPFGAILGGPGYAAQPNARCHVVRDSYGSQGRFTSVCGP